MPWLVATALLHSALATDHPRRLPHLDPAAGHSRLLDEPDRHIPGALGRHHFGAFLRQRSDACGFFILVLIGLAVGGALALFAWRALPLQGGVAFKPASRETTLLINNVLLVVALAVVFVGTLYPLALDALTGQKITVGAPFFTIFSSCRSSSC